MTIQRIPIPYDSESEPPVHLPKEFGSYHQLYRLDGQLIAMAVLDILPSCVSRFVLDADEITIPKKMLITITSSVYFMYDNAWERFSLGKVSMRAVGFVSILIECDS